MCNSIHNHQKDCTTNDLDCGMSTDIEVMVTLAVGMNVLCSQVTHEKRSREVEVLFAGCPLGSALLLVKYSCSTKLFPLTVISLCT